MALQDDWQASPQHADEMTQGQIESFCRAEDLKDVLQQLVSQLADVDRRQSAALQDMQGRLVRLSGHSDSVKANLPPHLASAFQRIEAGMTDLAERLTTTQHQASASEMATSEPSATTAVVEPAVAQPALIHIDEPVPQPIPERAMPDVNPAPTPLPKAEPQYVQNPDEPWDQSSANDLAKLYDSGEPGLPPKHGAMEVPAMAAVTQAPPVFATPVFAASNMAQFTAGAIPAVKSQSQDPGVDRTWLEGRLTDIVSRVERSLQDMSPDLAIASLGERFDAFENRVAQALDGVATRSDVDGLRLVEAHIRELGEDIEQTRGELQRLSAIETQVGRLSAIESQIDDVRRALSDDEIMRVLGGAIPTEDDLIRFAEEAATRVAERITMPAPAVVDSKAALDPEAMSLITREVQTGQAASARQFTAMQDLLSTYMDERRRGEAMTAEALDTMQQAMQHLIDRVEAMEAVREEPQPRPAQAPQRLDEAVTAALAQTSQLHMPPRGEARPAPDARSFAEEAKAARMAVAAATARSAAGQSGTARPRPEDRLEPRFDATAGDDEIPTRITAGAPPQRRGDPRQAIPPAGASAAPPAAPGDRQSLIAMARRAAEQARVEAAVKDEVETKPKAAGLKERLMGGGGDAKPKANNRSSLLLVASLVFVVAGYFLASNPKIRALGFGGAERAVPTRALPAPAVPGTPAKPATGGPAIDESPNAAPVAPEAPAEPQPAVPQRGAETRNRGVEVTAAPIPENAQVLAMPGTPGVQQRPYGIAIQDGASPPTAEAVMYARQKAHLAGLSQRTAQSALQTSAVPANLVPGGMQDEVANPPNPQAPDRQALELPPAMVGPMSLRLAAAKGDASAQFDVASRLAEGRGVAQDFEQAAVWYQRAATQGLAQAQYRLAAFYERGLGVKGDPARARVWYKRAAESGNLKAMHNLAVMSSGGNGTQPDYATALQWFSTAAEHGLPDSQFNLAVLHESGLGTAKNLETAYQWYALAARSGDQEAMRRQNLLKSRLDPGQLAALDAAVAEWRGRSVNAMANDPRVAGDAWKRQAANTPG